MLCGCSYNIQIRGLYQPPITITDFGFSIDKDFFKPYIHRNIYDFNLYESICSYDDPILHLNIIFD